MDGNARPRAVFYRLGAGFSSPRKHAARFPDDGGRTCMDVTVTEIHGYPLRPPGYTEPLFPTAESRRRVSEHLLRAPWLSRASEMCCGSGTTARVCEEPIELRRRADRVDVVRSQAGRGSWRRRRVVEVVARWREVRRWWSGEERVDRMCFRVLVADGELVDLALDRSGAWSLIGVVD